LSGRGLCDELITRPEESYRLCCVVVCDLETSRMGAPYIYDISHLRVKLYLALSGVQMRTEGYKNLNICVTTTGLVFMISLADLTKTSYHTNYRTHNKIFSFLAI